MARRNPGRTSHYPEDSAIQTILVARSHPKVRDHVEKAIEVARRFGAMASRSNVEAPRDYFRFRQIDPSFFRKGSFRTFTVPGDAGVKIVFGRLLPSVLDRPVRRVREGCTSKRTPTGKHRARPCEAVYRAPSIDLGVAVELARGETAAETATTLRKLLRKHGRSYVHAFSSGREPERLGSSRENPFAGYKDFAACVREKSKDPHVYSPGGVCATIERRSAAKHARSTRRTARR